MFLDYFALVMILTVLVILFYTLIYIHELPYEAAKHRDHPHADAIYVACWLSLFTLHALWPIIFIWALTHKKSHGPASIQDGIADKDWTGQLSQFETRLKRLEDRPSLPTNAQGAT